MKILFCGDSLHNVSGMGHVMLNIIDGLNSQYKDLEIVYCTLTGRPSYKECYKFHESKYKYYKFLFDKMKFEYCDVNNFQKKQEIFDDIVLRHKPDVVFSFVDCWLLELIAYSGYRCNFKWITYLTFETDNYPEEHFYPSVKHKTSRTNIKDLLSRADINIPVTEFGRKTLERFEVPYSKNVYHGLDHEIYHKIKDLTIKKSEMFGSGVKENDFIFMTLGKNSERKRVDFVIEAFYRFLNNHVNKENRNKYKLYVHSNVNETYSSGTDLFIQIKSLGLENNVMIPKCYLKNEELSKEDLFKKYLASDCYVSLSVGEGFGLGAIDAVLCKKPLIYSKETAVEEIAGSCGLDVRTATYIPARNSYINFVYPDLEDASLKMKLISEDKELYETCRNNCKAVSSKLTWKNCVNRIKEEIDKVYVEDKNKCFLKRII